MEEKNNNTNGVEDRILAWAREYAQSRGWRLNPDDRQLKAVIRGLARNTLRHGEKYCPCRIRSGDPGVDKDIICPCIYHEDEVTGDGHCHCNFFFESAEDT
jgi:ferredoxin-thioredoxin reductase catalytic chain